MCFTTHGPNGIHTSRVISIELSSLKKLSLICNRHDRYIFSSIALSSLERTTQRVRRLNNSIKLLHGFIQPVCRISGNTNISFASPPITRSLAFYFSAPK